MDSLRKSGGRGPLSALEATMSRVAAHPVVTFVLVHWQACFLIGEFLLDLLFIYNGPFHAIDFDAYLDQAATIRMGERDYTRVSGRTGPVRLILLLRRFLINKKDDF